jgi:AcrR family transcriptional regulator
MALHSAPAPKQSRSRLSTSRLLDAAAELIAEHGYERMTLAAIGDRAGYSPALVTARFGSKEGLLSTLLDRMAGDWAEQVLAPAIGESSGAEAVHTVLSQLRASWRRSPAEMRAFYTLMFEALLHAPWLRERMAALHRELRSAVRQRVERGISGGSVAADVDAAVAAQLIVGAIRGAVYQALLDPVAAPIDVALGQLGPLVDSLLPAPG